MEITGAAVRVASAGRYRWHAGVDCSNTADLEFRDLDRQFTAIGTLPPEQPVAERERVGHRIADGWSLGHVVRRVGDGRLRASIFRACIAPKTSRHASAPNHDNCPATSQCGWTSVRWRTPGSYTPPSNAQQTPWRLRGQVRETCRWPNRRVPFPLVGRQLWKTANAANAAAASNAAVNVLASSGTDRWDTVLREPKMVCSGSARYDVGQSTLNLDRLELTTQDEQRLAVKGTFSDLSGKCLADLQGQLTYDLSNLADRARPQLGNAIHLVGQDTHSPSRCADRCGPRALPSAPVDVCDPTTASTAGVVRIVGTVRFDMDGRRSVRHGRGSRQLQTRLEAGHESRPGPSRSPSAKADSV